MTIKQESVLLEDAQRVIAAGQAKAGEIGSPSNVAVVDPSEKKPTRIKTRVETVERGGREKTTRTRVAVRSGKDL